MVTVAEQNFVEPVVSRNCCFLSLNIVAKQFGKEVRLNYSLEFPVFLSVLFSCRQN